MNTDEVFYRLINEGKTEYVSVSGVYYRGKSYITTTTFSIEEIKNE